MPQIKLLAPVFAILVGGLPSTSTAFGAGSLEEGVTQIAEQITNGISDTSVQQIAVVEFSGLDGDINALGQILAEELVTQIFLVKPGRFQVVERSRLDRVIREQKLARSSLFEKESRATIARLLSVEAIITGTLADFGNGIKVNARAISIETGSVFAVGAANIPKTEHISRLFEKPGRHSGQMNDHGSSSAVGSNANRQGYRSFENEFFRIEYRTLSRSSDYKTLQMALVLESKLQEDLLVGLEVERPRLGIATSSKKNTPTTVVTERGGSVLATTVAGIKSVDYRKNDPEYFSTISPGNRYPIGISFRKRSSQRIDGETFSLSAQFVILKNGRQKVVTATLIDLQAE